MKKYLFTAAAMMVAMTSCVKEADVVVPQDDDKVWVEFAAGVQTKVALDDNAVIWEEDDRVSINGVEFAVKNESISPDKTSATFGAYVDPSFLDAENFTAVYPVEAVSWEGEYAPKVTIPTLQDGAANIVAMATVDNLESALAFRHVASFIKFQVPAEVSVVKLEVPEDSDDLLAGSFYDISFGVVDDKVTSITYSEVPYAATSITLSLPEDAKFQPATDYYVAVIPGVKKNLTLSFDDKVYKTWESVNIKQGMIAKVSAKIERNLAYKLSGEIVKEVAYTMGTEFTAPVLTGEMTGVVYASSNAEVATVSETGKVTIHAVGTTTITASAEENNTHLAGSASYTLTVAAAPKVARNLAFDPESVTVTYGETFTAPELTGETAGVVYTSTNPEVATVTPAGVVKIVKAGTTTITASAEEDDTHLAGSASYTLTVNKAARTLTFTESALEVTYGADVTEPTLNGVNDDETVVYTSSDETVATVNASGAVTVIKAGQTTITATVAATETHETASAEYTLTVNKAARTVSFLSATANMGNDSDFIEPKLMGVTNSDAVSYTTSDASIATVNTDGNVTRKSAGVVTITATVAETDTHNECTASYTLTVLKESKWRVMGILSWDYKDAVKMYEENNFAVAKNVSISGGFKLQDGTKWMGIGAISANTIYTNTWDGDNMTITTGTYDIYISKDMKIHNSNYHGIYFVVPAGTDLSSVTLSHNLSVIGDGFEDISLSFDSRGYLFATNVTIKGWFKIRANKAWADSWGAGNTVTSDGVTIYHGGDNSSATAGTYDLYTDFCKIWLMPVGQSPTL